MEVSPAIEEDKKTGGIGGSGGSRRWWSYCQEGNALGNLPGNLDRSGSEAAALAHGHH